MLLVQRVHSLSDAADIFQDLEVEFDDGVLQTNKLILAALSPYLADFLAFGDRIILQHHSKEDFSNLLDLVNTGFCKASLSELEALKCLTRTLRLEKLEITIDSEITSEEDPYQNENILNSETIPRRDIGVEEILLKTVSHDSLGRLGLQAKYLNNVHSSGSDLKLCYVCRAVLRGHHVFLGHLRQHTEDFGPFPCPVENCDFLLDTGLKLHSHFCQNHNTRPGDKRKVSKHCSICNEQFPSFTKLKKHTLSVHNLKPLKCQHCGQRFGEKGGLNVHIQAKHNEGVRYPCDVCGKLFSALRFLQFHRKEQHELGDARKIKCNLCSSSYLGKNNLLKHMKLMHSKLTSGGYQCQICKLSFKKLYNLKVHARVHTGDAPYSCQTCQQKFKRIHHLTYHTRRCENMMEKKNAKSQEKFEKIEFTLVEDTGHLTLLETGTELEEYSTKL